MNGVPQKRAIPPLFWRLYILVGAISIGAGLFFLITAGQEFGGARTEQGLLRAVGAVFVGFGMVRIVAGILRIRGWRRKSGR